MQVEKLNEANGEIRLSVNANAEEMTRAFNEGVEAFVTQFQLEGLEGATAREKIEKSMGDEQAVQAIYSATINFLVPFALEESGIIPLSTYGIESEEAPEEGKPFTFQMTVLPKPEFELSSYDVVEVTVPAPFTVTEADIDEQIGMLAREFAAAKAGKPTTDESLEVPEVTDEWVAQNLQPMALSTVEELKDRFRETSAAELASRHEQMKLAAVMDEYLKRFEGSVSEVMIQAMVQELYETFLAELARDGMTLEAFTAQQGMSEEDVRASLASQAENQLIQGFILDSVFRHENLKVELADLMTAVHKMAPGREDETVDAMQNTGRGFLLKEAAARMKAVDWIMENSVFNEAE